MTPKGDHGHPRPKFLRALETGSLILAELGARECGHLSLDEALRLTALVALHDRDRGERYALRWLSRYLAERPAATLDDVTIVVTCLRALGGPAHAEALRTLRARASISWLGGSTGRLTYRATYPPFTALQSPTTSHQQGVDRNTRFGPQQGPVRPAGYDLQAEHGLPK